MTEGNRGAVIGQSLMDRHGMTFSAVIGPTDGYDVLTVSWHGFTLSRRVDDYWYGDDKDTLKAFHAMVDEMDELCSWSCRVV